jgi:hypothetical protein
LISSVKTRSLQKLYNSKAEPMPEAYAGRYVAAMLDALIHCGIPDVDQPKKA